MSMDCAETYHYCRTQYILPCAKRMKMKAALQRLDAAVAKFSDSVSNFPVGAISIDDFKPIEEKIETTRESLKQLNTQLLLFKTKYQSQLDERETVEDEDAIFKNIKDATMKVILVDKVIRMCLHSDAINRILSGTEEDSDVQERIYSYLNTLFNINGNVISLQEKIISAYEEELHLKIECQNALYEHKSFLKEQEEVNNKNLEGITPGMSKDKQRAQAIIKRINLMKRLITTFVASSGKMLMTHSLLLEMLEKHTKLITMEQITKIMEQQAKQNT